jgi:kynurenine 3-monooxygenase
VVLLLYAAFLFRKAIYDLLQWMMPSVWVPLYGSVSFTCMPYKECIDNRAWQDKVLNRIVRVAGYAGTAIGLLGLFQLYTNYRMFEESTD